MQTVSSLVDTVRAGAGGTNRESGIEAHTSPRVTDSSRGAAVNTGRSAGRDHPEAGVG